MERVRILCPVTDAEYSMSTNNHLLVAIRGSGSHANKLANIISSFDLKVDIVYIGRHENKWMSELNGESPDALIIACPNTMHLGYTKAAISMFPECVIYCEKPFVSTPAAAKEAISLIREESIILGFNSRFSCLREYVDEATTNYSLGAFKRMEALVSYPFGLRKEYTTSWKSDARFSPQGVIENLAVHYIDLFMEWDDIETIICLPSDDHNGIPRTADIIGKGVRGTSFSIHCSYMESLRTSIILNFERGSISVNDKCSQVIYPHLILDASTNLSIKPTASLLTPLTWSDMLKESLIGAMRFLVECASKHHSAQLLNSYKERDIRLLSSLGRIYLH